ncbi:MAG: hypothetical protein WAM82_17190, partial [Thermoanaerobaculia bacterium]
EALRARAAERGLGLASVLVAALNRVLASRAPRRPFTTVVALASRDVVAADAPWAIGDFTSFSWVTAGLEPWTFSRQAAAVATTLAADLEHRRASPIEALRRAGKGRPGHDDAHRVVLTLCLSDPPLDWPAGAVWGDGVALTPGVDVDCYVHNLGGRLNVHWDYRPSALDDGVAMDMFTRYLQLLEHLAVAEEAWDASWTSGSESLSESLVSSRQEGWR